MTMTTTSPTTAVLLILDGWGYRDPASDNAISLASTPTWDRLWSTEASTLINTSGMAVGLPDGQMGNSEVGHMNLGAGRVVYQSLTRINKAIDEGDFATKPALINSLKALADNGKTLHIIGLLSTGGIHSHEDQIAAFIELAGSHGCKVCLHAILDGRDTPPKSASHSLTRFTSLLSANGGIFGSICGRYYAMDRDKRWERVEPAFRAICHGQSAYHAETAEQALEAAYARNETDEFVQPTIICSKNNLANLMQDGDIVIFMNFRADRARELTQAFVSSDFKGFDRGSMPIIREFISLTEYSTSLPTTVLFPPEELRNSLGEYLANSGMTQLRIAETEKYAHVTFFFSGGRELEFDGETRILVPSPEVATYDLKPEMSAIEVTDKLIDAIHSGKYNAIICNFANGDMVGHTGVLDAAIKAVEVLDECLERIERAIRQSHSVCLITADHGNVEQMLDPTNGQALTAHTSLPVPLVCFGAVDNKVLDTGGALCDIAPTLLELIQLPAPVEMTGRSLILTANK